MAHWSRSTRSSVDPRVIGLRAVHRLQLLPRVDRVGLCGSRVLRHEIAQEVDVAAVRDLSELLGRLREPNIFLDQGAIRERDAAGQLLLSPSIQSVHCTRPPSEGGDKPSGLPLQERLGRWVIRVTNDSTLELQTEVDISG